MSGNHFHCIDDHEHVARFGAYDLDCVVYFAEGKDTFCESWIIKAKELMERISLTGQPLNGEVHDLLHQMLEYHVQLINKGMMEQAWMLTFLFDHLKGQPDKQYDAYCSAVKVTNECGRVQYEVISLEVFKVAIARREFIPARAIIEDDNEAMYG